MSTAVTMPRRRRLSFRDAAMAATVGRTIVNDRTRSGVHDVCRRTPARASKASTLDVDGVDVESHASIAVSKSGHTPPPRAMTVFNTVDLQMVTCEDS